TALPVPAAGSVLRGRRAGGRLTVSPQRHKGHKGGQKLNHRDTEDTEKTERIRRQGRRRPNSLPLLLYRYSFSLLSVLFSSLCPLGLCGSSSLCPLCLCGESS